MNVTIKDVARIAGVSYSTVSKALNNSPLVTQKTKQKVLAVASQLGYQPNLNAKSLVSRSSHVIGVIWPTVEEQAFSSLITIVNEELKQHAYSMVLSINSLDDAVTIFNQYRLAGILAFCEREWSSSVDLLPSSAPLLYYGNASRLGHHTINVDRKQAIFDAVSYLHGIGHNRIAYIGDLSRTPEEAQLDKYRGYMNAVIHYGLQTHPGMAISVNDFSWDEGYSAAKKLLASDYDPTAVICASYELTSGVIRAIKESGYRIPENISVVSYDNIPQQEQLEPAITAVGAPVYLTAQWIVETILDLISDSDTSPVPQKHIVIPSVLTIRASSSAP
ncbi:MAG: LacI family transcriptional regulator [Gorillibacterium sp.]|nr:LacI family transcriptional regulator [Gorillibacterium sp.]